MRKNASFWVPTVNASVFDNYDYLEDWERMGRDVALHYPTMVVLGLVVFGGGFLNLSAIVVVIRRRLWLRNEGYIHLLSILVGNVVIIVVVYFPHWLSLFRPSYHVGVTADAVCRIWHFLAYVVFSTGWYVAALLLGVHLRRRLTRTRAPESGLGRRLTVGYCTLTAAKATVGVISGSFAVMNLWQLWSVELVEFSVDGQYYGKLCEVSRDWQLYDWEYASRCVIWFLPVLVVVPVLLVVILWSRRRTGSGGGFSFRSMDSETAAAAATDEASPTDVDDLGRAALLVGLAVCLLQSPIIVVHIWLTFDYLGNFALAYGLTHVLAATHLAVVPAVCLSTIAPLRSEIRSAATAGDCCPCSGRDSDDDDTDAIQLDSIHIQQQHQQSPIGPV